MSSPSVNLQVPVQRVLQLDATRFDDDLQATFERRIERHVADIFSLSLPSTTVRLTLRLIQFLHTTALNRATPGHVLQGLTFSTLSKWQRIVHLIMDVFLPYVVSLYPERKALGFFYALSLLLVRCRFVYNGRCVSLGHLLTGSSVCYENNVSNPRSLLFQLVDRQLVWQGLAELALCISPVIRSILSSRIFSLTYLVHVLRRARRRDVSTANPSDVSTTGNSGRATGANCVICQRSNHLNMPHRLIPCGCVACYVCLHMDDVFACPVCVATISNIERIMC